MFCGYWTVFVLISVILYSRQTTQTKKYYICIYRNLKHVRVNVGYFLQFMLNGCAAFVLFVLFTCPINWKVLTIWPNFLRKLLQSRFVCSERFQGFCWIKLRVKGQAFCYCVWYFRLQGHFAFNHLHFWPYTLLMHRNCRSSRVIASSDLFDPSPWSNFNF